MDTFFFVEVEVQGQNIKYGPYLNFSNAAEIMMDCLPQILRADLYKPNKKQQPVIKEYVITSEGWELVSIKAEEQVE